MRAQCGPTVSSQPLSEQLLALSFAGAEVRGSLKGLADDLQALAQKVEGLDRRLWARTSGFDMVKQRSVDLEVRIQSMEQQARLEKTGAAEVQRRQARRMRGCEQGMEDMGRQLGKLEAAVRVLQEASGEQEGRVGARFATIEQRQERLERELLRLSPQSSRGSSRRPGERQGAEAPPPGSEGSAGGSATATRLMRQGLAALERRLGRKMESLASTVSILHGRLDMLPQGGVPATGSSVAAVVLPPASPRVLDVGEEDFLSGVAARPPRPEATGRSRARAMELRAQLKPAADAATRDATAADAAAPALQGSALGGGSASPQAAAEGGPRAAGCDFDSAEPPQTVCDAASAQATSRTSCSEIGASADVGPKPSSDHRVRVALRDVFYRARPLTEGTDPNSGSLEQAEISDEPVVLQDTSRHVTLQGTDVEGVESQLGKLSKQLFAGLDSARQEIKDQMDHLALSTESAALASQQGVQGVQQRLEEVRGEVGSLAERLEKAELGAACLKESVIRDRAVLDDLAKQVNNVSFKQFAPKGDSEEKGNDGKAGDLVVSDALLQKELGKEALNVLLEELDGVCKRLQCAEGALADLQAAREPCKVGIGSASDCASPIVALSSKLELLSEQVTRLQQGKRCGDSWTEGTTVPEIDFAESSLDISLTLQSSTDSSISNQLLPGVAWPLSPIASDRTSSPTKLDC